MSQNLRQQHGEDRNDTPNNGNKMQGHLGFEGMNYEQLRRPYKAENSSKNKAGREQSNAKPPYES